jgi:two-component system, NtrC family, response regulator
MRPLITRCVPEPVSHRIANQNAPLPAPLRRPGGPLPEIRHLVVRAAGLPAAPHPSGEKRGDSGQNSAGIRVAARRIDVLDHPAVSFDSIVVGQSPRMRTVFDFVRLIADSESNVLIVGETGTGKETVASLIHHASRRRRKPFVAVSCAILTETLIESELFGHERGAFTGAIRDHAGRFETAEGGTIFLDDIDDVPRAIQVKLLRVLQNRTIERVGGTRAIPIDVRVITGSKRSLQQMAGEGLFREDLFYRLNVVPIWLPPLRERREDIPALTDHFLRRFFAGRGGEIPALSPVVRQAFDRYGWPGNVRELENACERIAQTCTCSMVRVGCMPASLLFQSAEGAAGTAERSTPPAPSRVSLDARLEEVEAHLITWALDASHGNKSRAAELLRIKRSTLGDRIRRLGLDRRPHGDDHDDHGQEHH